MRIGLIADTHDRLPAVAALIGRMQEGGVQMLLHAGDWCAPFAMAPILDAQIALAGVYGRCDGDRGGLAAEAARGIGVELYDAPHSVEVGGTRILLAHDLSEVAGRSIESHSIVVHGATHMQESSQQGDTLLVNPGEACGWLNGVPSAAILDIATREVEFLSLNGEQWRF